MAAYVDRSAWREEFDELFCDLEDNWELIEVDSLPPINEDKNSGWKRCQRKGEARFKCRKCHNNWSSLNGVVIFHYRLTSYSNGEVKRQMMRQKCKNCPDGNFEDAVWSRSEISEVLSSLLEKVKEKYYSDDIGINRSSARNQHEGRMNGPHRSDLCEACQRGICTETSDVNGLESLLHQFTF